MLNKNSSSFLHTPSGEILGLPDGKELRLFDGPLEGEVLGPIVGTRVGVINGAPPMGGTVGCEELEELDGELLGDNLGEVDG